MDGTPKLPTSSHAPHGVAAVRQLHCTTLDIEHRPTIPKPRPAVTEPPRLSDRILVIASGRTTLLPRCLLFLDRISLGRPPGCWGLDFSLKPIFSTCKSSGPEHHRDVRPLPSRHPRQRCLQTNAHTLIKARFQRHTRSPASIPTPGRTLLGPSGTLATRHARPSRGNTRTQPGSN
jgi:hypothetical protein